MLMIDGKKTMSEKVIKTKIGRGWTVKDFADYFQVNVEEFVKGLYRSCYENYADDLLKKMERNEKNAENKAKSKREKQSTSSKSFANSVIKAEDDEDDIEKLTRQLRDMKTQKAEIQQRVDTSKNEIRNIEQQDIERKKEVKKILERLNIIKREDERSKKAKQKFLGDIEIANKELEKICQKQIELEDKIESLTKVEIYVYPNGEFVSQQLDKDVVTKISDGYMERAIEIFMDKTSDYNQLTKEQIIHLAMLEKILKSLRASNREYEIGYANEELSEEFAFFLECFIA